MRDRTSSILVVVVLAALSGAGAYLLFKLLESQASVKGTWFDAGGAVAGFIIIYWMLDRSFRRMAQPSLTGAQTLDIIYLYQQATKHEYLRQMFLWIDEVEAGEQIPSLQERLRILDGIRHEPRRHVTGFSTPFANLNKSMEEKIALPVYKETLAEAMRIVESDHPSRVKRRHLWDLADSATKQIHNTYIHDLRKLKAL